MSPNPELQVTILFLKLGGFPDLELSGIQRLGKIEKIQTINTYFKANSISSSFGDPQTPGWPSMPEVHNVYGGHLDVNLPKIPVQPVNYDDARQIMKSLGGNQEAFQVITEDLHYFQKDRDPLTSYFSAILIFSATEIFPYFAMTIFFKSATISLALKKSSSLA